MTLRNPTLSNASRRFVQRVVALLLDRCPPPEEFKGSAGQRWRPAQWERVAEDRFERVPSPATLSDYWFSCYYGLLPELEESPEHAALLASLEADPTIRSQLGAGVGTLSHLRLVDANQVVNALVWGTIESSPGTEWDDAAFQQAYDKIERSLYADQVQSVVVAPLQGVDAIEATPIRLREGLEVDALTDQEISAALSVGVIPAFPPDGDLALIVRRYGVRLTYNQPKIVSFDPTGGEADDGAQLHTAQVEELHGRIDRVLAALRLLRSERIGLAGYIHTTPATFPGGGWMSWMPHAPAPIRGSGAYALTADDCDQLPDLFDLLSNAKVVENKVLSTALRRFGFSYERTQDDDRVVDLMIAMETIYLSDAGSPGDRAELSYRLRLRAAFFIEHPMISPRLVFKQVGRAYRARSAVVHGGDPEPKDVRSADDRNLGLREFADHVEDLVRLSLVTALRTAYEGAYPPPWEDLMLGIGTPR